MSSRNARKGEAKRRPGRTALLVGAVALALIGLLSWYGLSNKGGTSLGRVGGDLHSLLITADGRIIYGQHSGIQVSDDGGKSWTAPSGTGDAMALAVSPDDPDVLYQAGHDLFLRSEDGGETWQRPGFGNLPGTDIHGFAVAPVGDSMYANIAGQGLYLSSDGGENWEFVTRATGDAMALAAGPGEPPVLYALSMSQGPVRSDDGGNEWLRIRGAPKTSMSGIYVHPVSGNLYLAGQGGVYRSEDRGNTWQELGPDGPPMALVAADPKDEQKLVAIAQNGQVYRSDVGGKSWR